MDGIPKGSVALVTGAGGCIGSATVEAMLAGGAEVIATDLHAPEIGTLTLAHDVTDEEGWQRIAAVIQQRWGRLDVLVNNAGLLRLSTIEDETLASWRQQMAVNVDSMLLSHQAMLPLLKQSGKTRNGGASIVNLSSIGGLVGAPFMASYGASKGAVRLFTKCAALEFAALGYNIRVNSVHPGGTIASRGKGSGMLEQIIGTYVRYGIAPDTEAAHAAASSMHALDRFAKPEEIANGIVFLSSTAASFMTGSELVIDGGMTAG